MSNNLYDSVKNVIRLIRNDMPDASTETVIEVLTNIVKMQDLIAGKGNPYEEKKLEPLPGGVRQPVVTTTGDFATALKQAMKDRFGK